MLDSGCKQHMTGDSRMFNSIKSNDNNEFDSIIFGDNGKGKVKGLGKIAISNVWGIPSCGDDAVDRTMVRVVATVVRVSGDACRTSRLLYCFRAYFHTVRVWAEVDLLQVHNTAIV